MKQILAKFTIYNCTRCILLLFVIVLISACASHIEKRKYRKGFYFSKNTKTESNQHSLKGTYLTSHNEKSSVEIKSYALEKEFTVQIHSDLSATMHERNTKSIHRKKSVIQNKIAKEQVSTVIHAQRQLLQDREKHIETKDQVNGLIYFISLLFIPFVSRSKKIKRSSAWAARHILKSRSLLTASSLVGLTTAFELGNLYKPYIAPWMMLVPLSITAGSFIINSNYLKAIKINNRKPVSYVLFHIANSFGAVGLGANIDHQLVNPDPFVTHPVLIVILTLLLIAVFAASIAGIAALSCSIACGGAETLALFVFFGLSYFITFLISLGLFNLYKRESNRDEQMAIKSLITAAVVTALLGLVLILLTVA